MASQDLIRTPLLAVLSATERNRVARSTVTRAVPAETILFLTGDKPSIAHFLVDGVVKLVARDESGAETILHLSLPGELIGDVALLDGLEQPCDAITATRCRMLTVDRACLLELITSNPRAAVEYARSIALKARGACASATLRTPRSVTTRLAGSLLQLADALGEERHDAIELDVPLGQDDLGRLAGMCRESVCKTLNRFKKSGVLDYTGRRVRILRPDLLRYIRCEGRVAEPSRSKDEAGRRRSRSSTGT